MSYNIAIVGTKGVTAGFAAIGFTAFNVKNSEECRDVLFEIKKDKQDEKYKYAIVFVLEDFFKDLVEEDLEKLSKGALPAFISIPSQKGSTGFGEKHIKKIVEQAVGSDIF